MNRHIVILPAAGIISHTLINSMRKPMLSHNAGIVIPRAVL